MVVDLNSDFGKRVDNRLRSEQIIWLVTVGADGAPQPSPVWFYYNGETILIHSQPRTPKIDNIARDPRVALHFNSDEHGNNVVVLTGTATVDTHPPRQPEEAQYLEKYAEGIKGLGQTPEGMLASFSAVIRVTPTKVRGH